MIIFKKVFKKTDFIEHIFNDNKFTVFFNGSVKFPFDFQFEFSMNTNTQYIHWLFYIINTEHINTHFNNWFIESHLKMFSNLNKSERFEIKKRFSKNSVRTGYLKFVSFDKILNMKDDTIYFKIHFQPNLLQPSISEYINCFFIVKYKKEVDDCPVCFCPIMNGVSHKNCKYNNNVVFCRFCCVNNTCPFCYETLQIKNLKRNNDSNKFELFRKTTQKKIPKNSNFFI